MIKKETLAQIFSCEFREISKNTFSYRTPPVTACAFSRGSLFSFLYILIWFELKYIAKRLCEDPNVIFRLDQLVVCSLLPAMSSTKTYRETLNLFIGEQTLLGKFMRGICSTWVD